MIGSIAIREAIAHVESLRLACQQSVELHKATGVIKGLQSRRFAGTYEDLLISTEYGSAAQFFLTELYSNKDYSRRDAQFARIAGALQRLFPRQVVGTAVALAELHALTEALDHEMALEWIKLSANIPHDATCYLATWKSVARADDRAQQLRLVLKIGKDLDILTRTSGLRLMLKMMRRPAVATGLGDLQTFLELGFDTFANLSGKGECAHTFLQTIQCRETELMALLFSENDSSAIGILTETFERNRK